MGFSHTTSYAKSLYEPTGGIPFFAHWIDNQNQCIACCLGAVQGSRVWPFSSLFQQAHLTAYPACSRSDDLPTVVASLAAVLAKLGVMSLTIDSFASPATEYTRTNLPMVDKVSRAEFRIDLRPSLDVLWKALAANRRTKINRAQRVGLTLKKGHSLADVKALALLIAASADRWRENHGKPFDIPDSAKMDLIYRHLVEPGLATVYLAEQGNVPIAGNLIGFWNGQAYNMLGGSSPDGFKVPASTWLYWEIIKDLKSVDAQELNLGGVAVDGAAPDNAGHGLYEFKRQFGAQLVPCASPTYALRTHRFRWYQSLRRVKGWLPARLLHRN